MKKRENLKRLNFKVKSKDPLSKTIRRASTARGMRSFSWDLFAQVEDGPETSSKKKDKGSVMIVRRGDVVRATARRRKRKESKREREGETSPRPTKKLI